MGAQVKLTEKSNSFYRDYFNFIILVLLMAIGVLLFMLTLVLYQVYHRPLPLFSAIAADGKNIQITSFDEPTMLSTTIIRWASKAAVACYSFDFANYNNQINAARQYFTDEGWRDFQSSISGVAATVVQKQLFVSSVVTAAPVISNQGIIEGRGYLWRVQIPFLVTYQSANGVSRQPYTVILTIAKVPTSKDPRGMAIDQFVMA